MGARVQPRLDDYIHAAEFNVGKAPNDDDLSDFASGFWILLRTKVLDFPLKHNTISYPLRALSPYYVHCLHGGEIRQKPTRMPDFINSLFFLSYFFSIPAGAVALMEFMYDIHALPHYARHSQSTFVSFTQYYSVWIFFFFFFLRFVTKLKVCYESNLNPKKWRNLNTVFI